MLIQNFFFAFMLICMAALFVDMGIVALTHQKMQDAADVAALEGLRWRDTSATTANPDCDAGSSNDQLRRCAAADIAATALASGAGPQIDFTDEGLGGGLAASQTYNFAGSGAYVPGPLQTNFGNDPGGDMVSGTVPATPNVCPGAPGPALSENSDYCRTDFTPDSSPAAASFLVRLRRTAETPVGGVSSIGPPVPFMFGRATLIPAETQNGQPFHGAGVNLRAAAIAGASPVMQVGWPHPDLDPPVPGATSFSLNKACWDLIQPGEEVDVSGLCQGTVPLVAPPQRQVGAVVDPNQGGSVSDTPPGGGYLPIFDPDANRVIGFAFVRIGGGLLTRFPPQVCIANVSAAPARFDIGGLLLLQEALAPALVR
jgi:Flp pilus assembly protein TadG